MQFDMAYAIDVAMGAVVRRHRTRCQMSIHQLAELIGATVAQVVRYEDGTNKVSISRLLQLAEAFRVPAPYLVAQLTEAMPRHSGNPSVQSPVEEFLSTHEGQEIVRTIADVHSNGPSGLIEEIRNLTKMAR